MFVMITSPLINMHDSPSTVQLNDKRKSMRGILCCAILSSSKCLSYCRFASLRGTPTKGYELSRQDFQPLSGSGCNEKYQTLQQ